MSSAVFVIVLALFIWAFSWFAIWSIDKRLAYMREVADLSRRVAQLERHVSQAWRIRPSDGTSTEGGWG